MKHLKFLLTLLCSFVAFSLFAQQQHSCGLHDHDLVIERLQQNKKYLKEIGVQSRNGAVTYVPIKYHIIGNANGTSRVSVKKVMDMHCLINDFYAESNEGLQFYIHEGFNYIDNNTAYNNHSSPGGTFQLINRKVADAVNIYIPKDADTGSSIGTTLGYYSPANDWIVIRKPDANGTSLVAPHELGHYFSLLHPFNGWDFTPYNANTHGVTVGELSPDFTPNERMDGSNCDDAGDNICDTPPCYLFFGWPNCDYTGGARDPDGVLVDPDESNIMDYFDDSCTPKYLTPQQKAIVTADYDNRSELHTNFTPIATNVDGPPVIIEPADDSTTSGYDHVRFKWEPVSGADRYLIEVDRLSDFSLKPSIWVVYATHADVWGLFEPNTSYHWRVTPFNPYNTCGASTSINKFNVPGTLSTQTIEEVSEWNINPNPVSQENVVISMKAEQAFDATISLVSTTGQQLKTKIQRFNVGHTNADFSVAEIPNGIYILNIQSGEQLVSKKIIVAK